MILTRLAAAAALSLLTTTPIPALPPGQTIEVWSFGFAPKPIHLVAGQPVTLTFVNRSAGAHDFTAKAFFANAQITSGAAPGGEIELRPHETKSISLIPRAGSYSAHCSHFFHKQLGMSASILVS
jgi:plastocyanin